jgi:D-serine deaminase-like pyridoxal phosphate-dependent protein
VIIGRLAPSLLEKLEEEGLGTPCAVVDRTILEANLSGMASLVADRGCTLRPHFKTHRSIEIANRQLALGAKGLTCATVSEAEVLVEHGILNIFIAYPMWADGAKAARLRALQEKAALRVGVDSIESVERLAATTKGGPTLEVLIEVDPGCHRSGVHPRDVLRIAKCAESRGLTIAGVFAYPGHAYGGPNEVEPAAKDEQNVLSDASEILAGAGISISVRSGGSTPTARLSAGRDISEVRPGVYVFNDRQQLALDSCRDSEIALVVLATVVSVSVPGAFVVDAGSKALSSDRLPWMEGFGVVRGARDLVAKALYEHHGIVKAFDDGRRPEVGEVVAIVPNHVCNVVNLFNELLVVGEDGELERWPVLARNIPW